MKRIKINFKLIIVIFISIGTLAATSYFLRQWNRSHRAGLGLKSGMEAFDAQQWDDAAENLGKYIAIVPEDIDALIKYAEAQLNRVPMTRNTINQAVNSYRRVLRRDRSQKKALESLMEIYIYVLNSSEEAELISREYLKRRKDSQVRRMLAVALFKQRKFKEAGEELLRIIDDDPSEIEAYAVLGRFAEQRPSDFKVEPENIYDQAVTENPSSALAYIIRGEYHLRTGENSEAITDLNEAEKHITTEGTTMLRLADGFLKAGDDEKAKKHLDNAYVAEPDNLILWQIKAQLALKGSSKEQMYEVADRGCNSLTKDLRFFLPAAAELFILSAHYDRANEVIGRLKNQDNSTAIVAYMEGLIAREKGQTTTAIKLWRQAVEAGLNSEQVNVAIASAMADSGDVQSAIIQLRNYLTLHENSNSASLMLTELLAQTGKLSQAADHINKFLQRNPQSVRGRLLACRIKMRIPEEQDGQNNIRMAIEKELAELQNSNKDSIAVRLMLVEAAVENGELKQAKQLVDGLKKQYPSNQSVLLTEIDILVAEDNRPDAKTGLRHAMGAFPGSFEIVRYLVALYFEENDYASSEEILSRSLENARTQDDTRQINMLLAEVYERSGDYDKAYRLLKTMHETMPADIQIIRRLIVMGIVTDNQQLRQQLIDKIKAAEGQHGWQWRYEQARLWYESDDFNEKYTQIASLLTENLKTNPDDQKSRLLLAAVYEKAKKNQLATSTYKQVLERSPNDIEVVIPTLAAIYKAGEYELADQIIQQARNSGLSDTRLLQMQYNSDIRKGDYTSASRIAEVLSAKDPANDNLKLSVALLNMREQKYEQAGDILEKLRIRDPNSITVAAGLVELNMRQGNLDQAFEICDLMVERFQTARAYSLRARTHLLFGDPLQAKNDLEIALTLEPDSLSQMILLARSCRLSGQMDRAVEVISRAIKIAPDNFEAQKQAVLIFVASDQQDVSQKVEGSLEKAMSLNPEDVELLMLKAQMLISKRTNPAYSEAVNILTKATGLEPMAARAWAMSAEVLMLRGDYSEAMDRVLTGLAYLPGNKLLAFTKVRIEAVNSPEHALETLEQLYNEYPEDTDAAIYLAYMYINAERSDQAIRLLHSIAPSTDEANIKRVEIALAEALYENGKTEEALEKIDLLYDRYPDDPEPLLAHIRIYTLDEKWHEIFNIVSRWYADHKQDSKLVVAITEQLVDYQNPDIIECAEMILRNIINTDYENVDAMQSLGVMLHVTGRTSEALNYYENVLMIEPQRLTALNNMAWILCEEQGLYGQAMELAERGLQQNAEYPDLIDTRGVAKYRLGKYEESIEDFMKCKQLYMHDSPGLTTAHFHMARSLEKLGRAREARNHLEMAIELNKSIGGLSSDDLDEANIILSRLTGGY